MSCSLSILKRLIPILESLSDILSIFRGDFDGNYYAYLLVIYHEFSLLYPYMGVKER